MKTNASQSELNQALTQVNQLFDDNIKFKRLDQQGSRVNFTLTVEDSRQPGSRRSGSGRRIAAACWHVHGEFFDLLFAINPNAWISTQGRKITAESGNWQDWNIGSIMNPLYYSQACECD